MHLLSFRLPGSGPAWGVRDGGRVAVAGDTAPPDVATLLELPAAERDAVLAALAARAGDGVALDEVELLAPIPRPRRNVFAVGANYRGHVEESEHSAGPPASPIFFTKATTTVTGPGPVAVDAGLTTRVDWEVELAVVLGSGGRHLSREDAADAVFGYTTANDLSARDQQHGRPEGQWFLGKSLDGFCPLGPWLVTKDELPDPGALRLTLTVNGVVKQDSTTADMVFDVPALLAELSRFVTLHPGDVLLTGTPSGVGDARTPPEYLVPGDEVVAQVEGIGPLATTIVDGAR
ncbi:fumarylacetoacetate hydrolase family protein [Jiangella alkaliphila]|uniref:2-keto-4-pentenoate hydratase/2-oxohepta-3-ene-1,7-dioic acid hydratase (Catechol pathway) n=1 Tax=Jiangella alkaliphila TaxID=419479 RepID=A0A1H2J6K5_9ACTN|nr:fumarylacetoacetate hydrolase family protein [Jiangella alkaliphila]SDU52084.1 2-keto-4-pentenoate hydratase/2-oxohepta-3-ene-1,7-dioic acid hydratase (catechol pathway) [Jiangella alkaliphila]